ncbi:type I polyketide synthase [Frankia alni]|nr:type I polyketide synthase [Frankia alni]
MSEAPAMSDDVVTRPEERPASAMGHAEDAVAVIGMGCRLPGGVDSPASLWELLVSRRDAVGEPPPGRWVAEEYLDPTLTALGRSVPRQAGFLADIAGFDADFFGVSQREADVLDPQHRLLLEVAWEAFDHAGLPAERLADTATGVFIGLNGSDYAERLVGRPEELEGSLLVNGPCVASGRIAYLLGLHGPCLTVDTACSSSLVGVHLACRSLAGGECDVAIAGGVALMLSPRVSKSLVRMSMLSPTSRCHAFDAAADGFGRGEGAGLVVLKRLADARRDGDRVLAVIRGTAVNQDGRTDGLSVPSEQAQYAVAKAALRRAGVDPADVGLVEAHGTGTTVGDPVEFQALSRAYGGGTQRCALGSVKTNLGHLEPASGVTSLIKTVLCLQHAQIPANLHFHEWNPAIAGVESRFFVPTDLVDWPVRGTGRVAAVSSFGFSGTNAHVVVAQAPSAADRLSATDPWAARAASGASGPDVVVVPAGSAEVLPAAATRLADWLAAGADSAAGTGSAAGAVRDVAYTLARRRATGRGRLGVVAFSRQELVAGLRAFAAGRPAPNVVAGTAVAGVPRDTVWVFSGQGSQWAGMGRDLLVVEPAFAAAIAEVDPLIRAETGISVLDALRAGEELVGCDRVQPVLFAVQLGLAALWRAHGVRPAAVIGHSMGEVAAAVVAGALSVADGARVICRRSRLLTRIAGAGAMATVGLDRRAVAADLTATGADREVSVAVLAAPGSTVVAGAAGRIDELVAHWTARGIPAHPVAVDVASHSPQVDPLLGELAEQLAELDPRRPETGFYGTVEDSPRAAPAFDAAYWCANLRRPVRFTDAVAAAAADGHRVFLEISPNPVVAHAIAGSLAGGSRTPVVLPTLRRDGDGQAEFRIALAAAHCAGVPVDWSVLYPDGVIVDVPPLVFDRRRHWIDAPLPGPRTPAATPGHGAAAAPLPGLHSEVPSGPVRHLWRCDVGTAAVGWLADHRVHGRAVLPGAAYCAFALSAAAEVFPDAAPAEVVLTETAFEELLDLDDHTDALMTATPKDPDRTLIEIFARSDGTENGWSRRMSGVLRRTTAPAPDGGAALLDLAVAHPRRVGPSEVYRNLRGRGIDHGPAFAAITDLHAGADNHGVWATVTVPPFAAAGAQELPIHPVLLDACAQALVVSLPAATEQGLVLPAGIDEIRVFGDTTTVRYVHGWMEFPDAGGVGSPAGHVRLLDAAGTLVAALDGMRYVHHSTADSATAGTAPTELAARIDDWLYGVAWQPQPRPPAAGPGRPGRWLVLGELTGSARDLAAALAAAGADAEFALLPGAADDPRRWARGTGPAWATAGRPERVVVVLDGPAAASEAAYSSGGSDLSGEADSSGGSGAAGGADAADAADAVGGADAVGARAVAPDYGFADAPLDPPADPLALSPVAAERATRALLTVVQTLAGLSGAAPRLFTVTRGARALTPGAVPDAHRGGVRGLLRVLAHEHPEYRMLHLDADPAGVLPAGAGAIAAPGGTVPGGSPAPGGTGPGGAGTGRGPSFAADADDLADELLADDALAPPGTPDPVAIAVDDEIALRSGIRFVARVVLTPVTAAERHDAGHQRVRYGRDGFALRTPESGDLDDLRVAVAERRRPGPGQVEVRVRAAGVNFRDVLLALGVLPPSPIGFECAGVVTAVGPDVTAPRPGDEVVAVDLLGGGAFGSFLTTDADLTMPIPAGMDAAAAAGLPVAFATAWYALREVADLRAGESVLIHSATGGTGLAAIAVARLLGAEVLATAGTPEKRAYLRGIGVRHVMDSRSLDFAAQARAATGGRGVDVVLNSLTGPAIRAGLETLAPFGRFIELGLRDILADSPLGLLPFRNSITLASVNAIELCREQRHRVVALLRELSAAFAAGDLVPLPVQSFPLASAAEAFRFMAGARHIGKIVLTVPDDGQAMAIRPGGAPSPVRPGAAYIITGGLGGVGLATAAWLTAHRAGRVVLCGRSAPSPEIDRRLTELAAQGTDVRVVLGDVAEPGVAERLVAAATADDVALRGVVHSAMVLRDAALTTITAEQLHGVWHPKVFGAARLHAATEGRPLDWFVLYSSISSLFGIPGQGSYASANSWLDGFADWRSAQGLPTTSINWGVWGEIGGGTIFGERGYETIPTRDGLYALETVLAHGRRHAGLLPGDPIAWIPPAGRPLPVFSAVIRAGGVQAAEQDGPTDIRARLRAAAAGEPRRALFEEYLGEHLRVVLRLSQSTLDPDTLLRSFGFDSLLALELRSRLEPALGITLPGNFVWRYPTIAALATGLADFAGLALDGGDGS